MSGIHEMGLIFTLCVLFLAGWLTFTCTRPRTAHGLSIRNTQLQDRFRNVKIALVLHDNTSRTCIGPNPKEEGTLRSTTAPATPTELQHNPTQQEIPTYNIGLEVRHPRCVGSITKNFVYYTYSQTQLYFTLYICIPTNCTQLIYFINNTLKHMYCLKL